MDTPLAAAIAVNRFGLGAKPGEIAAVGADARDWLKAQLKARPPVLNGAGLEPASRTLAQVLELRQQQVEQRRAKRTEANSRRTDSAQPDSASKNAAPKNAAARIAAIYRPAYLAESAARFSHSVATDRPFLERLTQFWTNHFAVSVDKNAVLGLAGAMEREAIRPRVTGDFSDLLLAVEKHPAMLLYLDNAASVGPNSKAAGFVARRGKGGGRKVDINENLAREILELHTLGVNGGYTQADVTTFAKAISGWSVGGQDNGRRFAKLGLDNGTPGEFFFRDAFHEPGAKALLGQRYSQDGLRQGETILRDLAVLPATAKHLSLKLARHFIADDPPPAVVERLTKVWLDSRGNLAKVYEALVDAPEAWDRPFAKFKTPADYIYSSYRALALRVPEGRRALQPFETLGQRHLNPGSPAGWPDTSADWDGPSALLKRIAWADALAQRVGNGRNARDLAPQMLGVTLSGETATAIARAESGAQALTLLLSCPEFMRR
jgi:uncharacterized protein (DUF1800 family)